MNRRQFLRLLGSAVAVVAIAGPEGIITERWTMLRVETLRHPTELGRLLRGLARGPSGEGLYWAVHIDHLRMGKAEAAHVMAEVEAMIKAKTGRPVTIEWGDQRQYVPGA